MYHNTVAIDHLVYYAVMQFIIGYFCMFLCFQIGGIFSDYFAGKHQTSLATLLENKVETVGLIKSKQ